MSNEIIFFTQIASVLAFIATLFILYRLLVNQKDSTIELLKEKNTFLELKLSESENQQPDILVQTISTRVKVLTEELERLSKDKEANENIIKTKEAELNESTAELTSLRSHLNRAQDLISEFFCPYCKAPMLTKDYHSELVAIGDKGIDVDHEFVVYECGLSITDGAESQACGAPY